MNVVTYVFIRSQMEQWSRLSFVKSDTLIS